MADVESIGVETLRLEPKLIHLSKLVTDELNQIDSKENMMLEQFRCQLDECSEVRFAKGRCMLF